MTHLSALDAIVMLGAVAAAAPYSCRLSMLLLWRHRTVPVLLHVVLACGALVAGFSAGAGDAGAADVFAVAAAWLWIAASYETWRDGVPAHMLRKQRKGGAWQSN